MVGENNIDVSVIIAAYNVEFYIKKCIESALSQKGVSIEVIVIDDLSTDRTIEIVTSMSDPRISIISHSKNSGPGIARNAGICSARGEWVAILDGDDTFGQDRLSRCLHRGRSSHSDIVIDNLVLVPELNGVERKMFTSNLFRAPSQLSLSKYISGNCAFLGGWTLGYTKPVFRKSFVEKHNILYPEDIRVGEDYIFMADMLAYGAKCTTEPTAGYRYLVRSGSISHRLDLDKVKSIEDADEKFLKRHELDSDSLKAQNLRNRKLRKALAYTNLVNAIKTKKIAEVISICYCHPSAPFYLWRPLFSRLKKLYS